MMAMSATRDEEKAARERLVFRAFLDKSGLPIDPATVESRSPPEPDIFCMHRDDGPTVFELVELRDCDIAKLTSRLIKSGGGVGGLWTSDPTPAIILRKLGKSYRADLPVDLLIYTDGALITPDDVILPTLEHLIEVHGRGSFRRIWLMGEKICREVD
jgi:hypothetical protein